MPELNAAKHDDKSGGRADNRPGLQAAINKACGVVLRSDGQR
jgi:hypothetical protein